MIQYYLQTLPLLNSITDLLLVKNPFERTQLFQKGSQKMMTNDIIVQINKPTMKPSITIHFAIKYIL